jgi:hypothetical protein
MTIDEFVRGIRHTLGADYTVEFTVEPWEDEGVIYDGWRIYVGQASTPVSFWVSHGFIEKMEERHAIKTAKKAREALKVLRRRNRNEA